MPKARPPDIKPDVLAKMLHEAFAEVVRARGAKPNPLPWEWLPAQRKSDYENMADVLLRLLVIEERP